MSSVALLGVLPRIPIVISEIAAAPEAQFQPATARLISITLRASTHSQKIDVKAACTIRSSSV